MPPAGRHLVSVNKSIGHSISYFNQVTLHVGSLSNCWSTLSSIFLEVSDGVRRGEVGFPALPNHLLMQDT